MLKTAPINTRGIWLPLIVLCMAQFLASADNVTLSIATHALMHDLGASMAQVSAANTMYPLIAGTFMIAGGMLGGVFNQLAFMVNDAAGPALGWLFCGLILLFGHSLNIAMSCLSAFVHPLRLTFVEYFKNSGYDGKGEAYKPFTVVKKQIN